MQNINILKKKYIQKKKETNKFIEENKKSNLLNEEDTQKIIEIKYIEDNNTFVNKLSEKIIFKKLNSFFFIIFIIFIKTFFYNYMYI